MPNNPHKFVYCMKITIFQDFVLLFHNVCLADYKFMSITFPIIFIVQINFKGILFEKSCKPVGPFDDFSHDFIKKADIIFIVVHMGTETESRIQNLSELLQQVQHNFAYRMLYLEIELDKSGVQAQGNRSQDIAQLMQLYMKAVEALQSKFDQGFSFFNKKIQTLMKKRSVVEELFKSVDKSLQDCASTMKAVSKAEVYQRKEEFSLNVCMQNDKYDHNKVQEIIKNSQLKMNMIESRIKTGIISQQEQLAQRIKMRRMKSQTSTIVGQDDFDKLYIKIVGAQNAEQSSRNQRQRDDFDQTFQQKLKRSNLKQRKGHLFNSFSNYIS